MTVDSHGVFLLVAAFASVIVLVGMIAVAKINPFVSLFIASLGLALAVRMPLLSVVKSFETGLGSTLGHIAIVVGLGTMLGKMMAESGAADQIALTLMRWFGERNLHWAMLVIGLLVGLPVFFEVAFVLLIPIAFTVSRRSGLSILRVGLPMVAGMSVVHGLVPPHPAALMAVGAFNANVGRTVLLALLIGIPAAVIAGPLFTLWISPRMHLSGENSIAEQFTEHDESRVLPSFSLAMVTILMPVFLMLLGGFADKLSRAGSGPNSALRLVGNPDIALLLGVLLSFVTLGKLQGFGRDTILRFTNECLAPTATITLLVGAGGGFGRILQDSGVSQAIITVALSAHVSLILLTWVVAALIRLATGSATVAMTTAAGIVAPIAAQATGQSPELLAISSGAGSLIFSHVNDGGFWLVKEYFGMTVPETLKTWSVCETIISVLGLCFALGLSAVLKS